MRKRSPFPTNKLLISVFALVCVVFLIARFYHNNGLVFSVLLLVVLAIFLRYKDRKRDLIPFFVGAIVGPSMESIIIYFGAWEYANPTFAGIPLWLPLLWGCAAFVMNKIAEWLKEN